VYTAGMVTSEWHAMQHSSDLKYMQLPTT
jgi:hypothetical protein